MLLGKTLLRFASTTESKIVALSTPPLCDCRKAVLSLGAPVSVQRSPGRGDTLWLQP